MQGVDRPLVSILIPTLNEGASLPMCLGAVRAQSYPRTEVVVIDSASTDGTREAASKAGATIVDYPGRPLGARREGLGHSRGDLILLLDADQVLFPDSLERAVTAMQGIDMLVLEESSYQPRGLLQNSIARQKRALQQAIGEGKVPPHVYPRLFRRRVLEEAYARLPQELLSKVFTYDDRILFSKASQISSRIGALPRGVMHMEERKWREMLRHSYRMGRSSKATDELGLAKEAEGPEPSFALFKRALRNRYLTYSLLKELSFRLGRWLG